MVTQLSTRSGSLVLLVQGSTDPTMEEWDRFLDDTADAMEENDGLCRVLVLTEGGKPNAMQRSRALERGWSKNTQSPVAVVTEDRLARGAITVFSWFGLNFRAVRPDRLEEAFEHLSCTKSEQDWIAAERRKLEKQLEGEKLSSASG